MKLGGQFRGDPHACLLYTSAFVSDVSCEQAFVEQLAALCTQLQLYPCHLYDVVLDAIS